jgi:hypothetical protein
LKIQFHTTMISALYLMFDAQGTWEKIVREERRVRSILSFYLLPLALLSVVPEWFFLTHWGWASPYTGKGTPLSGSLALRYEGILLAGSVAMVFLAAWFIQMACKAANGVGDYRWSFRFAAYALGPILALRTLNGIPGLDPWLVLGAGVFLSLGVFYRGIPRVLRPAPAQALGLFIVVCFVIISLASVNRLGTLILTHYGLPPLDFDLNNLHLHRPRE